MELTQVNQLREVHAAVLIETAGSYELQRVEMVCEETSQLSFGCCVPLGIWEGTLDGSHDTKQHHLPCSV